MSDEFKLKTGKYFGITVIPCNYSVALNIIIVKISVIQHYCNIASYLANCCSFDQYTAITA